MEKHALSKILKHHIEKGLVDESLPSLKIIGTFKDQGNLYFLTELLKEKMELWQHCRSFGLVAAA